MKIYRNLFGWIFAAVLLLPSTAFAYKAFPNYPPSQNPNFRLIESATGHAVFEFVPKINEQNPSERVAESVFLGIPPSSVHNVELQGWDLRLIQGNEVVQTISGEVGSASIDFRAIKKLVDPAIKTKRNEYQELDILQLEIAFPQTADLSDSTQTYRRDKVIADRLVYKVSWKERGTPKPAPASTLDAGYEKLFGNLVINSTDALRLRAKRQLPQSEKVQGFHPIAAGYIEEGTLINRFSPGGEPVPPRNDAVRVLVRETGVTAVRPADLIEQGVDPSLVKLDWVKVWHKGQEVASAVFDDGDTVFNNDDAIYFYGQKSDSPYTNDRPYYLTWGAIQSPPKRVEMVQPIEYLSQQPTHTAEFVVDDNRVLGMDSVNSGDWFYAQLDEQKTEFPVSLPGFSGKGQVEITLSWMNKNQSTTGVMINVGDATRSYYLDVDAVTSTTFRVPAAEYVQAPTVHISLHEPPKASSFDVNSPKKGVVNRLFLDAIAFQYQKESKPKESPMVLHPNSLSTVQLDNATDELITAWVVHNNELTHCIRPRNPLAEFTLPNVPRDTVEIHAAGTEPGPFTVDQDYPSTLHRKDQGFDYIIIAYRTLLKEAERLAKLRAEEGFEVLLTDVQDIYDEFNYGYPSCDAIKRFLRYTQSEWDGVSPEFVTLIGESSWDHRDYEGFHVVDQIPTYAPVEDPQNYASDEWYAYLWPEDDNAYSDVIIGRISLSTPEEVENYIKKVVRYEQESPVGVWKARNLFISDDNFWQYSYTTAETSITEKLFPEFVNQNEFPHETSPYLYERFHNHPSEQLRREYSNKKISSEATLAVLNALNEGALITQYYGHGGAQLWSHERLFYGTAKHTSNVRELNPTTKFPFVLNWSCLTGYLNISTPPFDVCLAEEFIRYEDRGAVAVWAPSENGYTDQHELMSHFVVRNLINDGLYRLGEAANFTKAEYLLHRNNANDFKLMEQYILFGDPGIKLAMPAEKLTIQTNTKHLYPGQTHELSLRAQSASVQNGKAIISISLDGKNIYESNPVPVVDGLIEAGWTQDIPETDSEDAILRVYAWNEETNTDAWGGIRILLMNPTVSLGDGAVILEHNPHTVNITVHNISQHPVSGLQCLVEFGETMETISVDTIQPQSSLPVQWQGILPNDVDVVYVTLQTQSDHPVKFENHTAKKALPVYREPHDRIIPLTGMISTSPEEMIHQNVTRLQIPFRNLSSNETMSATTFLQGPGSATQPKLMSLNAEQERQLVYSVTPPETGTITYTLLVETEEAKQEYPITVEVKDKPDLALAEGDITITPEQPVIGKTVIFKTHIYNMGESTARNVSVTAYDGDPSLNKKLTSFRSNRSQSVTEIAPGEMEEVEILWDPEAYDGLGVHEIHFVIDPFNRIEELSEDNNTSSITMSLADLPDLAVNPWVDHHIEINDENRIPVWGEPMKLTARVRNTGDTPAEYIRMSFIHNREEISRFIPRLRPTAAAETQVEIPLLSAKHELMVYADKYNLIGEKNEFSSPEDNNISKVKRHYVQLQMPREPIVDNRRYYNITSETQFSAGLGDHLYYDPSQKGLTMRPPIDEVQLRLNPVFVENPENYHASSPINLWQWNIKYNVFSSPVKSDAVLRFRVPTLNGTFDVYAQLYSNNPDKSATDTIQFKVAGELDYQTFVYGHSDDPKAFHKIGTYTIEDDTFVIEFKAVPGGFSTNVGDLRFIFAGEDNQTVSAGYLSPYFPAEGATGMPVQIKWDAEVPKQTALRLKARWVIQNPDGSLRFLPWARMVDAEEGEMKLMGKGDYVQYFAEFEKAVSTPNWPVLSQIRIAIPCKDDV